jgi:hypothetical protein
VLPPPLLHCPMEGRLPLVDRIMNIIHFFVNGRFVYGGEEQKMVPRIGETIVFGTARVEYKVTNVISSQQPDEAGDVTVQVHMRRIQ